MNSQTVVLNGRRYDAVTGKLLGTAGAAERAAAAAPHAGKPAARSIDGFMKPGAHLLPQRRSAPADPAAPHPAKSLDVKRPGPHHAAAHKPQHAVTLMRHAVKKPGASLKRQVKVTPHTGALVQQPHVDIAPKHAATAVDAGRLKRAHYTPRSTFIRHFGTPAGTSATARPAAVATAARPRPSVPAATRPAPAVPPAPQPPAPVSAAKHSSADVFERALARATSHTQPPFAAKPRPARRGRRLRQAAAITGAALAVLVILGFVAYSNATAIRLHLAASRAGINATLPGWRPSGFAVQSLTASQGTVDISFHDNSTAHSFQITQAASDWNSQALLDNFVYPHNESYNTIQSAGSTIYTYGKDNATWVNAGIWYRLTTDGSLSTSQLVRLATSM